MSGPDRTTGPPAPSLRGKRMIVESIGSLFLFTIDYPMFVCDVTPKYVVLFSCMYKETRRHAKTCEDMRRRAKIRNYAKTRKDTQRHAKTSVDTQRHAKTRKDTQRHAKTCNLKTKQTENREPFIHSGTQLTGILSPYPSSS